MQIRVATRFDISEMGRVRMSVLENTIPSLDCLQPGDTDRFLETDGRGWVCEADDRLVGFAIAARADANVYALFVEPGYERRGIGRALHDLMMHWFFDQGTACVWLSTDPKTRAERFYRAAGWQEAGMESNGEIRFEMSRERWLARCYSAGPKSEL